MASRTKPVKGASAAGGDASPMHIPADPYAYGPGTVSDHAQLRYVDSVTPPLVASASGNPCVDCPLPIPPLRIVKMSERPSTSGGPASKSQTKNGSNFNKYDKRISRDDFYLSMRTRAGIGSRSRDVPFQEQLPTPESNSISRAPPRQAVPVVRLPTPESFEESSSVPIGMALGSPTHQPTTWTSWNTQQTLRPEPVQAANPVSPLSAASSVDTHDMMAPKKQSSGRWKLFSRFGRRQPDNSLTVVSISEYNELNGTNRQEQIVPSPQPETVVKPFRSNTTSFRKAAKQKPVPVRSQTMPNVETSTQNMKTSKSAKGKKQMNASVEIFGSSRNLDGKSTSDVGSIPITLDTDIPSNPPAGSLLDVEIPSVTMERYSVMFGSVLQKQPASSLLVRRQANLGRLRTINESLTRDEDEKTIRPRRVTSPAPTDSPSFSLFPLTPSSRPSSRQASHHQPSLSRWSLARSNTSPAVLSSPSRPTFHPPPFELPLFEDDVKAYSSTNAPGSKFPSATLNQPMHQALAPQGFHFGSGQSGLIAESPTAVEEPDLEEVIRSQSIRHKIQEPKWQMINPGQPTPSTAPSITSSCKRSPSSVSSAKAYVTRSSLDLDEPDNSRMNLVEISIARQISISRQQQQMLQPLQTSFASSKTKTSSARSSPMPRLAMAQNERLAETKSAIPTMVVPRANFDSQLAQHRRSEHLVLEG